MKKILRFPEYIVNDFCPEKFDGVDYQTTQDIQKEQRNELRHAILYIEDALLPIDLSAITPECLLKHILQIHYIASQTVSSMTSCSDSGEYSTKRLVVTGETGDSRFEFEYSLGFSQHNYDILCKAKGKYYANAYKKACQVMEKIKKELENEVLNTSDANQKNAQIHLADSFPRFKSDHRLSEFEKGVFLDVINPRTNSKLTTKQMQLFSKKAISLIVGKVNPIKIAAFFHQEIIRIHPFANGNGRVARLLMNTILLYYGYHAVSLKRPNGVPGAYYNPSVSRAKYHEAVLAGNEDLGVFVKFLDEKIENHKVFFEKQKDKNPALFKDASLSICFNNPENYYRERGDKLVANLADDDKPMRKACFFYYKKYIHIVLYRHLTQNVEISKDIKEDIAHIAHAMSIVALNVGNLISSCEYADLSIGYFNQIKVNCQKLLQMNSQYKALEPIVTIIRDNLENPSLKGEKIKNTCSLDKLNRTVGSQMFFGVIDENYHIDAVAKIETEKQSVIAKDLHSKLKVHSFFYKSKTSNEELFCIENINSHEKDFGSASAINKL